MKYIVTSMVRSGSTWLAEVLAGLLDTEIVPLAFSHALGTPLSAGELELVKENEGVVLKTHSFTPKDAANLRQSGEFKLATIRRPFLDVITSYFFYVFLVRPRQGLESEPAVESFIREFGGLEDRLAINLFMEARTQHVEEKYLQWLKFTHLVLSQASCTIEFEGVALDPARQLDKLIADLEISVTPERRQEVLERTSFDAMKEKFDGERDDNSAFVRSGKPDNHRRWLDSLTIQRLVNMQKKHNYKRYNEIP